MSGIIANTDKLCVDIAYWKYSLLVSGFTLTKVIFKVFKTSKKAKN